MTESAEKIGGVGERDRIGYLKCSARSFDMLSEGLRLA